jgi:hypothetical protein
LVFIIKILYLYILLEQGREKEREERRREGGRE